MRFSLALASIVEATTSSQLVPLNKRLCREFELVKQLYVKGDVVSLKKMHAIVKQQKEKDEMTSRTAAYVAALGLKLNHLKETEKFLPKTTYCPTTIRSSLKILYEIKLGHIDEAIDELEKVLNEEEEVHGSANQSISDQALDAIYQAITAKEDNSAQMKRFRKLQKVLTGTKRRTELTIDELLNSRIEVPTTTREPNYEIPLTNKIIEQVPHFLSQVDYEENK